MFKRKGNGGLWSCRTGPGSPFFWYASFLYFLKRVVFVKWHVSFFRIYISPGPAHIESVHVVSTFADVFVSLCPGTQEYPASRKQKTDKLYFSIIITPLGFVCQRYFFLNLAPIKSLFYAVCWIYISCALDIYALRIGYISPVRWTYISCMLGYYTLHER